MTIKYLAHPLVQRVFLWYINSRETKLAVDPVLTPIHPFLVRKVKVE